jgi:ankyrin repeat protein
MERLIALDAELEDTNGDGKTPLMNAGQCGRWRTVRLLVDARANVRAVQPGTDMTALHFAVSSGNVKTVRVLLSADVDVDASSRAGLTPLLYGVAEEVAETVSLLLQAGADPGKSGAGGTPLHQACRHGRLEIVRLLLRAGADPGALDPAGATALHIAITEGNTAIVSLLLMIADVEQPGACEETTPLFAAVAWERAEIVQMLLASGADVRRLSLNGLTMLHVAV